jgi:hypothetical protein
VSETATVLEVKQAITQSKASIAVADIKLIYAGRILVDSDVLTASG